MKICILAAGAGGMYCGSCLRDNALAQALLRLGHEVTLVPLYSPIKTDTPSAASGPVFFGGINVYLQHASRLFRHTPRFFDWLLDRPWLLKLATNYGTDTPVAKLGALTLDLLHGDEGGSLKEVRRLSDFIKSDLKPDVVSLPNLMFIGVAGVFARELKIPVVVELTGEDIFLDALIEPYRTQVQAAIRAQVPHVAKFVATSDYYADRMADYLAIPRDQIDVVYPGLSREYLQAIPPGRPSHNGNPPTVGYLARIGAEKGIDRLVDAMILLRDQPDMQNVQLRCAGYLGKRDAKLFDTLQKRVENSPLRSGMHYLGQVDQQGKIDLLRSADVFSAPSVYPEAKGIYVLESLAAGTPVVQPAHGSFPELLARTGGGTLTPPGDAPALANALADLLRDPVRRAVLGERGRQSVHADFTDTRMAEHMLQIYQKARP